MDPTEESQSAKELIDSLTKEQLAKFLDHSMETHMEFLSWVNKNYPIVICEWEKYQRYKYKLLIRGKRKESKKDEKNKK